VLDLVVCAGGEDVDRELAAVGAPADAAGRRQVELGVVVDARQLGEVVGGGDGVGQDEQRAQVLADEVGGVAAEHALGGRVDRADPAGGIHRDDAVLDVVEQHAQAVVAFHGRAGGGLPALEVRQALLQRHQLLVVALVLPMHRGDQRLEPRLVRRRLPQGRLQLLAQRRMHQNPTRVGPL
jgi:hypothetical protein